MTNDSDHEHEQLARLFAETAHSASGPTLTKLAARASDIPGQVRARPHFRRWAWLPALAGVIAAGAALAPLFTPTPVRLATSASSSARLPVASSAGAVQTSAAAAHAPPDDEPLASAGLLEEAEEGEHFEVTRPESDRDLDAWLAATKEVSGGS